MTPPSSWPPTVRLLLTIVAALGVAGLTITIGGNGEPTTISFHVDRSGQPGTQTGTVTVPVEAVKEAAGAPDLYMRDETPAVAERVAPEELTAAQREVARIKATQPPLPTAGASQGFIGCRTEFVRNQSSRNGTRPQLQVLHYTVSPNRLGWSDVDAIVHLFDTASAQASSNFVIDTEGNCAYIVPIEAKAWTQAAANPYSVSYEVIDTGKEALYLQPAGFSKLRSVMVQVAARTGIPMRAGAVDGCVPTVTGIIQHKDLGLCGGGHYDIAPFDKAAIIRQLTVSQPVLAAVTWLRQRKAITAVYRRKCLHAYQREVRPVTCAKLRADARKLDKLLSRK